MSESPEIAPQSTRTATWLSRRQASREQPRVPDIQEALQSYNNLLLTLDTYTDRPALASEDFPPVQRFLESVEVFRAARAIQATGLVTVGAEELREQQEVVERNLKDAVQSAAAEGYGSDGKWIKRVASSELSRALRMLGIMAETEQPPGVLAGLSTEERRDYIDQYSQVAARIPAPLIQPLNQRRALPEESSKEWYSALKVYTKTLESLAEKGLSVATRRTLHSDQPSAPAKPKNNGITL